MEDKDLIRNQKGTALVEAAIILMALLMLIFGIIELSLLLFNKQILTNASREGSRAGIVIGLNRSGTDAECLVWSRNEASRYCASHLVTFGSVNLNISSSIADSDGSGSPSRGDDLTVSLTYDYDFLFLSAFGIGPVQLSAVSIMKLE